MQLEVDERLRRRDAVERADAVGHVEKVPAVDAHDLDQEIELSGGDDDVVGLLQLRDLLGHLLWSAGRSDAYERHRLEAESERVRHRGHLKNAVVAEALVARADRRLGDAELAGDPAERVSPVPLQRLDQGAIDVVEPARPADRPE